MNEDQALPLICGGALILLLLAAIALFIYNLRSFTWRKQRQGNDILLTITAKRNLSRVTVQASFDGEEVRFERKRVRKGQSIDFSFPYSEKKTKVTAETESGSVRTVEV